MRKQFSTPPSQEWYANCPTPPLWRLVAPHLSMRLVLELGACTGWLSVLAREAGATVITSDIFTEAMHPSLSKVQCSAEHIPFPDGAFDSVICCNTLHHTDLSAACAESWRVLKPGGVLVSLQEPCIPNEEDEIAYLKRMCAEELAAGLCEHRPSLVKYKRALAPFHEASFYVSTGNVFEGFQCKRIEPLLVNSFHGGIAIKAVK